MNLKPSTLPKFNYSLTDLRSIPTLSRNVINPWNPGSWQSKPATQLPIYTSSKKLTKVLQTLSIKSGLVGSDEIDGLREALAKAAIGDGFLLQAGDCAESFGDSNKATTFKKIQHLLFLGNILSKGLKTNVIHVGRLAGQYAKPRSSEHELCNGELIPSYKGDMINGSLPCNSTRTHDPYLMLRAYKCANRIFNQLTTHNKQVNLDNSNVYTSHEALLLYYEQALTRNNIKKNNWYNLSTHFPWVGVRTAIEGSAHLEYLRGIANPIGIKVGANSNYEKLKNIILMLDPDVIPGRLTLIYRMGVKNINNQLPILIDKVSRIRRNIVWCCDPMHGNSEIINGIKIRYLENIKNELASAINIHNKMGVHFGGIHLESTHEKVIECVNFNYEFNGDNIKKYYKSLLDPRLNRKQSIETINHLISIFNNTIK